MYIFDGAMGTMLQAAGLEEGYCPELFNVERPEVVKNIHAQYLQHGSDVITTNTFGACSLKLEDYNLQDRVKEINIAAVKVAKEAIAEVKPSARVAGSMGPTGRFLQPLGNMSFDDIYDTYKEQADALIEGGVDFIIIETIIDVQEMRAALLASLDARNEAGKTKEDVQIICQFSFSEDGRTITGTPPAVAATIVEAIGADIIGINCSLGPEQITPLIEEIASVTNLPISCQPNAGMPQLINKQTVFPLTAEEMGPMMLAIVDAGASYVGGCCGTTPAHIQSISNAVKAHIPKERAYIEPKTIITSRTKLLELGHNVKPLIIGERINPTGRKVLAQELRDGSFIRVKRDALDQVEAGADILDVNMGVAGMDQTPLMEKAIFELSMLVETPLSIDTLDPAAMEVALKNYPGRALINSVNGEEESITHVMPLAKRYGAALLCLPLSSGDLPEKAEDRVALAESIVNRAYNYGLQPHDLLLDPLVLTLASGEDSARQTLKTLRLYKEKFGFPTVMGLSNISFGMPQRPYLNGQFLTMALASGLTTPIMNPLNYAAKKAFVSSSTLLGWDPGSAEFIKEYGYEDETTAPGNAAPKGPDKASFDSNDPLANIRACVEQGEKEAIVELVKKALADGMDPLDITKKGLSEAMNVVGDKFGSGKLFLPQVMLAAETMQAAFNTIKEIIPASESLDKGTVIVATVKGDIHDLGKNIVAALLENNGYKIVDLGKDVDPEVIVQAIKDNKAALVGICSLMTTTMPQIDNTIAAIRAAGLKTKVMVGGAVVSQDYADQAGADIYAKDGIAAVNHANDFFDTLK
ncbi:homocysteine S-methyltransferase family protein [Veillonella tobetsuensis]|uniref:Methionine synthase n=1 Tax=Veillonella tobetsuensis TaxID=1110546 RepID=A0A480B9B3_9FIRM|nr:homocysteine S-methyltransferase family protein [Veillonella tobetsuensis]GCL70041.1 5-methyltetrahydrofolate--homocysteine methyltransferase [Veillonella tobetsuensis]